MAGKRRKGGLLAGLLMTAARTASVAAEQYGTKTDGNGEPVEPGCTPCEAMARRRAAAKRVKQIKRGR